MPSYRGRTRSDQRHLLVELELDDSVVLAPAHYDDDHGQHQRYASTNMQTGERAYRRTTATGGAYEDSFDLHYTRHPSQYAAFDKDGMAFETTPMTRGSKRPQSAKPRASYNDRAMNNSRSQGALYQDESSAQAQNAQRKLLSPYKLKQKVLSSRQHLNPTPDLTDRDGRRATHHSTMRESPLALLSSSLQQNTQLRDQLVLQLQREVSSGTMSESHDYRFSPPQLSPRLVKMLNKLRSLSLSIVEMQLYFRKEIMKSAEPPAAVAHLERELHAYLLQMISSDVDFLSSSTPLIQIFDSNGVSLVRNPLVEGLSLDSSELLLCSCNQVSSSSYTSSAFSSPFSSSPASSSSLFQLLVQKLEAFALYMRRHVLTWQVLPSDRVAVALLHLIELENHVNATRLLPSYLRPPSATNSSVAAPNHNRFVQRSNPSVQVHHQPSSWTDFAEGVDDVEKESPVHPRSSFVAWHTGDKSHEVQTITAEDTPADMRSDCRTSAAPCAEPSIPSLAESKLQSAIRASTKKRKGSKAEETGLAREKQLGSNSSLLEKINFQVSQAEASDDKSRDSSCSKHEAMNSLDESAPCNSVASIVIAPHEPEPDVKLLPPPASVKDAIQLEDLSRSIDLSTFAEVALTGRSVRVTTSSDSQLTNPLLEVVAELKLEQRTEGRHDSLGSSEISSSRSIAKNALEECADQPDGDVSVICCARHNSPPLVATAERSLQKISGSIEDKVDDSRIVGNSESNVEEPEDGIFEYSSEKARSMIASALDMLPSFSMSEPLKCQLSTVLMTSDTFQAEPTLEKMTSDNESSPENDTLRDVADVSNELSIYDFEEVLEDGELMVNLDPEKHLASVKPDTCRAEEPVLERIYALCRDVQVTALDMGYHLDNLVVNEFKRRSPVQSPIVRSVPSFYEPPLYLERELKMLRRYFRPWRDFALEQKLSKRALRRRTALRQICTFVYDSFRARQFAQLQLESLKKNVAAGRIQKVWAAHLLHVRVVQQKAAFRSAHMAFRRFVFFVWTNKCQRRREAAKEKLHRWWRSRRDAWRKQEAGRARGLNFQKRRNQAAKEVQCFFRETVLRQRLARVTAQKQQILFKSQLFSLKARQEEEKRRKKELRQRREVESAMKSAINDLESKWKQAEAERTKLMSHHERALGRYQHVEEKRRQQLAQLKITTFLDNCLLHRKIKRVSREKADNHEQWRIVSKEKAILELDTELLRAKDKVQLRVLHRKLAKLEQEKTSLTKIQQLLLETHKQRSQQLHEHVARTTIKAFIDARLLQAKARKERLEQLRTQKEIRAEKNEQVRMVREEIVERDRVARAEMKGLEMLLNRAQQDVTSLTMQQRILLAEKALEAAAANKVLVATVAEKNGFIISKWVSEQIRASREKTNHEREKAELVNAVEMERQQRLEIKREQKLLLLKREEEKRSQQVKGNLASLQKRKSHMKQHMIAEKRQREAATATVCSFVERCIKSSRRVLADEQTRLQQEKRRDEELKSQLKLQKYLIAAIVDTRFVAEKLAEASIKSAASSIYRISAMLCHKHIRLQYLKRSASTRKVQRCWRSWRNAEQRRKLEHERINIAQDLRRYYCARQIQRRCHLWKAEVKKQEFAKQVRQERCLAIRNRLCSRRIQRRWRQWHVEMKQAREKNAREARLHGLYRRACARRIQCCWRLWQLKLLQTRLQLEEHKKVEQVTLIRRRCCARKIQKWAKRILEKAHHQRIVETEKLRQAQKARDDQLERIRKRTSARKIQQRWRKWRIETEERQKAAEQFAERCLEAELARLVQADCMHRQACTQRIQRTWRMWRSVVDDRRKTTERQERESREAETARVLQAATIRRHACARKIQRKWRMWRMTAKERIKVAKTLIRRCLRMEIARCAQAIAMRRRICARTIQRRWQKWTEKCQRAVISAELDRIHRRVCGRRILRKWWEWRKKCEEIRVVNAAVLIETVWRGYYTRQQFASVKASKRHGESRLFELRLSGFARKIQLCWGQWLKRVWKARRAAVKLQEDKLIHDTKNAIATRLARAGQESAAVIIQSRWATYRCRVIYVGLRGHLLASIVHAESTIPRDDDDPSNGRATQQPDVKDLQGNAQAETVRTSQACRLGFRLELQHWVCHQLPGILSEGISAAERSSCAAHVVQRSYRGFRNRQRLHFRISRPPGRAGDGKYCLQFWFSGGRAWMTSENQNGCRLRFNALMTRKLLLMFDPGAHTALELREALEEIAADVRPIFEDAQNAIANLSGHSEDVTQVVDVDEMDLPGLCVLTRKMGRIRSMHKRSQGSPVSRSLPHKLAQEDCMELTIFDAVASASVEDAQFLLDQGADLAAASDPVTGRGALHMLALCTESYRFRLEMLEFLINRAHVNVNALDNHGETPLMLFAVNGHLELMRKLIDYGADLSIINKKGQNVLHRACELDQVEVCGYLHEKLSLPNSSELDASQASLFLHDADSSGRSPLHILAEKGFVECAKQLVSPSEYLINQQCCRTLLSQRDADGRTPLHLAILFGHLDIAALLLENTPDSWIDYPDRVRRSSVHLSVDSANAVRVISLLSDRAANMSTTDERGDTPLHFAALSGRMAVVQALLDCGADPTALNNDWEIPAQVAAAYGHFDCVRLLLNAQKQRDGVNQDLLSLEAELGQQQASGKSYYYKPPSPTASMMIPPGGGSARCEPSARVGYWEELHQEVQLVEESGNFSSEDEDFLDQDDDVETDRNDF